MKITRYTVIICILFGLFGLLVIMTLVSSPRRVVTTRSVEEGFAKGETVSAKEPSQKRTQPVTNASGGEQQVKHGIKQDVASTDSRGDYPKTVSPDAQTENEAKREEAVGAWDALVDHVIEQTGRPTADQAVQVKEVFDAMDSSDQMDGVRRALNLFSDEQFPVLYGILFDKKESEEVLDAIFSDALNRPEELKNPLMKELRKDREHPMFFESARILDIVEPDETKQ